MMSCNNNSMCNPIIIITDVGSGVAHMHVIVAQSHSLPFCIHASLFLYLLALQLGTDMTNSAAMHLQCVLLVLTLH